MLGGFEGGVDEAECLLERRQVRPHGSATEIRRNIFGEDEVEQVPALGIDCGRVEVHDIDDGGDCVRLFQMHQVAGRELNLKDVFALRSVAALAGALESRGAPVRPTEPPIARTPVTEGVFALSYSQERLWFLAQLEPDSPAYNISGALRLRGPLEARLVQRAFDALARRHAALRTGFEGQDGAGVQRIHPDASVPVRFPGVVTETSFREPGGRAGIVAWM